VLLHGVGDRQCGYDVSTRSASGQNCAHALNINGSAAEDYS
jgi:hypothetical protein